MEEKEVNGGEKLDLDKATEYLFNRDYLGKEFHLDPNQTEADAEEMERRANHYLDVVDELLEQYPGKKIYASWAGYVRTKCLTLNSVVNWEHLFWNYGGQDFSLKDPYDLLGYLYYRTEPLYRRLDARDDVDDRLHILESIAMSFLERTGAITLDNIDSYAINTDERVLAVARKYRAELGPADGVEDGPAPGEDSGGGNVGDSQ